jgi:hypothetical protein
MILEMGCNMENNEEQYAADKFNTRSLLEAYNNIGDENLGNESLDAKQDQHTTGALMYTYSQMMDSYREGTIDGQIENSLNGEKDLTRTSFEEDLQ